jgi:hypothetical protein
MGQAAKEFFSFLRNFEPAWVLAILVGLVVSYRLPQLLREFLTGIREHSRVQSEIRRKQEAAERQLAARREKIVSRKAKRARLNE